MDIPGSCLLSIRGNNSLANSLPGEMGTQKRRFVATAALMSPFFDLKGYSSATWSSTDHPDRALRTHTQRSLGSVQENEASLARLTHGFRRYTGNMPEVLITTARGQSIPSKAMG